MVAVTRCPCSPVLGCWGPASGARLEVTQESTFLRPLCAPGRPERAVGTRCGGVGLHVVRLKAWELT